MRRLLFVGDACVASGFARATHHTCNWLDYRANLANQNPWDVTILGINYLGDPTPQYPYPIYPAIAGGDYFGLGRIAPLVRSLKIDCIVIQQDVWNIPPYMEMLQKAKIDVPVIATLAVDGKNCQGYMLNDLTLSLFWTKFGEAEARKGGYTGRSAVVPLGVDLNLYRPLNRVEMRKKMEFLPDAKAKITLDTFVVGNINRNQYRKRFDLLVEYFCDWIDSKSIDDAALLLHTCPTGDTEFDVEQLMEYRGHRDKLILVQPQIGQGVPEAWLSVAYAWFDCMATTTQGEGFGLTTFEGMACGIPQIVPDWSGLGELCEDAAVKIPCTSHAVTQNRINVIGGIADRQMFIDGLHAVYSDKRLREELSVKGRALVERPEYRWQNIGRAFANAIDDALGTVDERVWQDLGRPMEVAV